MILKEVKLERFKAAFRPEPISLEPFNVLIGRNGSGKSTLLEALQWLDVTIRQDARVACDRYYGMQDLVNLRSRTKTPFFCLDLKWFTEKEEIFRYHVKVEANESVPAITEEELVISNRHSSGVGPFFTKNPGGTFGLERLLVFSYIASMEAFNFKDPETESLALFKKFWSNAVFLRLSPNRLANGSSAIRKSFEPLLDEEGQSLPALLHELTPEQRNELAQQLEEIMPGIRGVETSRADQGRDIKINYSLLEQMPHRGRSGRWRFPIPSWMLSEGTRRITAILALLIREPAPSLLCIEEIENGLDPWTVRYVLKHLQSAASRGTQVIVTTHSPWLLDDVPMDSILQVRRIDGETRYERFSERPEIQAFHPNVPAGTRYIHGGNS